MQAVNVNMGKWETSIVKRQYINWSFLSYYRNKIIKRSLCIYLVQLLIMRF